MSVLGLSKPPRAVLGAAVAGTLLAGAAVVVAVAGAPARAPAALAALALGVLGAAVIGWAKALAPGEPDEEVRQVRGPGMGRRALIARVGAGAAVFVAAAVVVPAARRIGPAEEELMTTPWSRGMRVVTDEGDLVQVEDVAFGDLLTVYPEGWVGANDAQLVLVREPPERIEPSAGREDWSPEGFLAYSKLCTHMGCPVGLYQQRSGTLLCPCHQAVFDALRGGAAVQGPARRALPQLPLSVNSEGVLVAAGALSGPVGGGFWGRP